MDGYFEFLSALLSNPRNLEHDATRTWVGGRFDPEAFDLDTVNRRLMDQVQQSAHTAPKRLERAGGATHGFVWGRRRRSAADR